MSGETPDGFKTRSGVDTDQARQRLDEFIEDLDPADVTLARDQAVPEDVESRLKELGYV